MKLYSKNGSIPKTDTDGTEGWIEVPLPPTPGKGEELVWWFPPGWVVRPVKPDNVEGYCWSWSQSENKWILCSTHAHDITLNSVTEDIFNSTTEINFSSASTASDIFINSDIVLGDNNE